VKAHARGSAPDKDVSMLEEEVARLAGALESAKEEDAGKSEGDGDDGLVEVALVAILVQSEPGSSLVAINVAGVGAKVGEAGAHGTAQGKLTQHARHGWPTSAGRILRIPAAREGGRISAIGDHDGHGKSAGSGGVVQWRSGHDLVDGSQELAILGKGEAAHEDGAFGDFLVGRLGIELGEKVHGTKAS